jgi:Xaa-Pro aminopeptidase
MFQSFDAKTTPDQGPPRVADLRAEMQAEGVDVFLVPRADRFQGEYVAPVRRTAGLADRVHRLGGLRRDPGRRAGLFVDGRYRVQVRAQADMGTFTPVDWPETKLEDWLIDALPRGGVVGYDPWLHTGGRGRAADQGAGTDRQITLRPVDNLVDRDLDRPPRPAHGPRHRMARALCGLSAGAKLDGRGGRSGARRARTRR